MDLNDYIKREWNTWIFKLRVIPNAKENKISWIMDNWILKVRLKAIPEKWKANLALIKFISEILLIKKSSIKVISWITDQNKVLKIDF